MNAYDEFFDIARATARPHRPSLGSAPPFPANIFKILPERVEKLCYESNNTPITREIFSLGALSVLGSVAQEISVLYMQRRHFPFFYLCIQGPSGSGKSAMEMGTNIANGLHNRLMQETEANYEKFRLEMKVYKNAQDIYAKKGEWPGGMGPPHRPKAKPDEYVFAETNITGPALIEFLARKKGNSLVYRATELESLINSLKGEFGGFGDLLRAAWSHENFSKATKTGGVDGGPSRASITKPKITLITSGTYSQAESMFSPGNKYTDTKDFIENGLFSRFQFYRLVPDHKFANPNDGTDITDLIQDAENDVEIFNTFCQSFADIPSGRVWVLNKKSAEKIQVKYQSSELRMAGAFGSGIQGIVRRRAVYVARWASLLATLYYFRYEKRDALLHLPARPEIPQQIFDIAFELCKCLDWYQDDFYRSIALQKPPSEEALPLRLNRLYQFLKPGKVYKQSEIVRIAKERANISRSMAYNYINNDKYFVKSSGGYEIIVHDLHDTDREFNINTFDI